MRSVKVPIAEVSLEVITDIHYSPFLPNLVSLISKNLFWCRWTILWGTQTLVLEESEILEKPEPLRSLVTRPLLCHFFSAIAHLEIKLGWQAQDLPQWILSVPKRFLLLHSVTSALAPRDEQGLLPLTMWYLFFAFYSTGKKNPKWPCGSYSFKFVGLVRCPMVETFPLWQPGYIDSQNLYLRRQEG